MVIPPKKAMPRPKADVIPIAQAVGAEDVIPVIVDTHIKLVEKAPPWVLPEPREKMQDYNCALEAWLGAYPIRDTPLKTNVCFWDKYLDRSNIYQGMTDDAIKGRQKKHRREPKPPPDWIPPNPTVGWHGGRPPTVLQLLNYAEKHRGCGGDTLHPGGLYGRVRVHAKINTRALIAAERERYEDIVFENEVPSSNDEADIPVIYQRMIDSEGLRSWLSWHSPRYASRIPLNGLERLFEHVPENNPLLAELAVKHEWYLQARMLEHRLERGLGISFVEDAPVSPFKVFLYCNLRHKAEVPNMILIKDYVKFPPSKRFEYKKTAMRVYMLAVQRYRAGKSSLERLNKLALHLGIAEEYFVAKTEVSDIRPFCGPWPENYYRGITRETLVGEDPSERLGLPPPEVLEFEQVEDTIVSEQEFIGKDEAEPSDEELKGQLADLFTRDAMIASSVAKGTAEKVIRDQWPRIEYAVHNLVRAIMKDFKCFTEPKADKASSSGDYFDYRYYEDANGKPRNY